MRKQVDELNSDIESRQFMAHANSILEGEASKTKNDDEIDDNECQLIPLTKRLDRYYEDKNLANKKPNLAEFPPAFQPIPCKPAYFDLAQEHLDFPNLEAKINQGQEQGQKQGWLGGWLGGGAKKWSLPCSYNCICLLKSLYDTIFIVAILFYSMNPASSS